MNEVSKRENLPTLDELRREFAELEDWDERYDYLIDLGRMLPPLPADDQTPENLVHGCMSTVWLVARREGDKPASPVKLAADSDSLIIKGLLILLLAIFNGKTAQQILQQDERSIFAELGLDQHLSPQRRNGLFAMVKRLRDLASRM